MNFRKVNKNYILKSWYDSMEEIYLCYMTEKYYRNGFVDGVQLIKGCCDSSRPF